ncbi:MAG: hypothetical protein IPI33_15000 [Dehalococcoidia bacterium]|uniref:hypothetical protein n=1 Tax=Candidatus Amarobacter glycogenicus TaxID=3140699 RepID=UPI001D7AFA1D|nr:hypothetical protein [Dehalococcoidia bacterium]MBK7125581.1 hypothetical protein [Dehalococcoidia bacterium]MBK7726481.1 hypothetical protein [Dehalococcoidia bacterium]MBK9344778.1 hypothetical protein [Dehalococcoidia bacterium]MBK9546047.1 hypothetical protein [Dehalococcoidia bacterium]
MTVVSPKESPPLGVIMPFFVVAPLGLAAAGLMLLLAGHDAFLAVNVPRVVAATHAAVLGWLTLTIMGAIYQLGPAVFGGRLISLRLVRLQFATHVISVVGFILVLERWNVMAMSVFGSGIVISFILFLVSAIPAVQAFRRGSVVRAYVSTGMVFLVAVACVGATYLGTLEHLWFPVTQGRLSGHAHLGLLGWLGIMVMGVSYQLVPMFQVVPKGTPRFALAALATTAVATSAGAITLMTDPAMPVRVAVAVAMAAGPALWFYDVARMLRTRSRRVADIHTRATVLALAFLVLAAILGVLAAIGEPVSPGGDPARLQLAYGIVAIGGWAGTSAIGNSFKIVPFLVWNARYRERAGLEPVPLVAALVSETWTHATLVIHALAVVLLAGAALLGQLTLFRAGGLLLALGGLSECRVLLSILIQRPAVQRGSAQAGQVTR